MRQYRKTLLIAGTVDILLPLSRLRQVTWKTGTDHFARIHWHAHVLQNTPQY